MRRPFLRFLWLLGALPACNSPEPVPSPAALMAAHNWHLTAWTSSPAFPATINGQAVTSTNLLDLYRAVGNTCTPDQHFTFALGPADADYQYGTYTYREGTANCGSLQRQHGGQWYHQEGSGKTLLYLRGASSTYNAICPLLELTDTRLIITDQVRLSGSSTVYTRTYTYTPE